MNAIDLQKLSRQEIQQLAKKAGIKANDKKETMMMNLLKAYPDGVPRLVVPFPKNRPAIHDATKMEEKGTRKSMRVKTEVLPTRVTRSQSKLLVKETRDTVAQPTGHADSPFMFGHPPNIKSEPTELRVHAISEEGCETPEARPSEEITSTNSKGKNRAIDRQPTPVADSSNSHAQSAAASGQDHAQLAVPADPWVPSNPRGIMLDPLSAPSFPETWRGYLKYLKQTGLQIDKEGREHVLLHSTPAQPVAKNSARGASITPLVVNKPAATTSQRANSNVSGPVDAQGEELSIGSFVPTEPPSPVATKDLSTVSSEFYGGFCGAQDPDDYGLEPAASKDERGYEQLRQSALEKEKSIPAPQPEPEPESRREPKPAHVLEQEIEFLSRQLAKREVEVSELRQDLRRVEETLEEVRRETAEEVKELRECCEKAEERFQALLKVAEPPAVKASRSGKEPLGGKPTIEDTQDSEMEELPDYEPGGNKWPYEPCHYFSVASIASAASVNNVDKQKENRERAMATRTRSIQKGVAKMERETYAMGEKLDKISHDTLSNEEREELRQVAETIKKRYQVWKGYMGPEDAEKATEVSQRNEVQTTDNMEVTVCSRGTSP